MHKPEIEPISQGTLANARFAKPPHLHLVADGSLNFCIGYYPPLLIDIAIQEIS